MKKISMPWFQQLGETDNEYDMFQYYYTLGEYRNLKLVANRYKLSLRSVASFSRKWNWVRRLELYTKYSEENERYPILDYVSELDMKKGQLKLDIYTLSLSVAENVKDYIENFAVVYDNDSVKKKLKFLREYVRTMKSLLNACDFKFDTKFLEAKAEKIINYERFYSSEKPPEKKDGFRNIKNMNVFINNLYDDFNKVNESKSELIKEGKSDKLLIASSDSLELVGAEEKIDVFDANDANFEKDTPNSSIDIDLET